MFLNVLALIRVLGMVSSCALAEALVFTGIVEESGMTLPGGGREEA